MEGKAIATPVTEAKMTRDACSTVWKVDRDTASHAPPDSLARSPAPELSRSLPGVKIYTKDPQRLVHLPGPAGLAAAPNLEKGHREAVAETP